QRRLAGQQLFQNRGALTIEDQQRIAVDRSGEDLMDRRHFVVEQRAQPIGDFVDRAHRDLRHLELDTMSGQLRQRRRGTPEADVEQLDKRVLLDGGEIHYRAPASAVSRALKISVLSNGLLIKAAAPASPARS